MSSAVYFVGIGLERIFVAGQGASEGGAPRRMPLFHAMNRLNLCIIWPTSRSQSSRENRTDNAHNRRTGSTTISCPGSSRKNNVTIKNHRMRAVNAQWKYQM
ncbi:unnamed protein product, partial [Nesidiocoris tenuis]